MTQWTSSEGAIYTHTHTHRHEHTRLTGPQTIVSLIRGDNKKSWQWKNDNFLGKVYYIM